MLLLRLGLMCIMLYIALTQGLNDNCGHSQGFCMWRLSEPVWAIGIHCKDCMDPLLKSFLVKILHSILVKTSGHRHWSQTRGKLNILRWRPGASLKRETGFGSYLWMEQEIFLIFSVPTNDHHSAWVLRKGKKCLHDSVLHTFFTFLQVCFKKPIKSQPAFLIDHSLVLILLGRVCWFAEEEKACFHVCTSSSQRYP